MNDPEGFLSRWSRRKLDAGDAAPDHAEAASPEESVRANAAAAGGQGKSSPPSAETPAKKDEAAEPAFDLSTLPSIESITAETDIRMFLAPGVPPALTREALRRVWVVDPKIRNFIEMAENQWDFTAPGVPGFDLSPPTGDIARMVAEIFGKQAPAESAAEQAAGEPHNQPHAAEVPTTLPAPELSSHPNVNEPPAGSAAQESNPKIESASTREIAELKQHDVASQQDDASRDEDRPRARRGHGSAVPR